MGPFVAEFFRVISNPGVQSLVKLGDDMADAIGRLREESHSMVVIWPLMSGFATKYFYPLNTGNHVLVDVDATINRLIFFFYDAGNVLKQFMEVLVLLERRAYELRQKKAPDAGCMPLACAFMGACVARYWSPEFQPDDGMSACRVQQRLLSMCPQYTSLYAGTASDQ